MARKNVFGESPEAADASEQPARVPLASTRPLLGIDRPLRQASPVGAISQSLGAINGKVRRAEEIEQLLATGYSIVEIDADLIDVSFIEDRIRHSTDENIELIESIREHGQQVPILVRPKAGEQGRYQVAYGHRRLRAARELGLKVRAVVRELNDEQLVVAQGQENSARRDLTFIERARFAARLEERKFSREIIMAALTVDKAALSRLISVASRIPPDIIEAIGPAPAYGRQRWQELMELLDDPDRRAVARKAVKQADFASLGTDQRFEALQTALKTKTSRNRSQPWTANDGTRLVRISESEDRITFAIDKRITPNFGEFVQARLQQLYDEFRAQAKLTDAAEGPAGEL
jgi:ParB family chromosome partitioning protein